MIGILPSPYDDETLYSILARYKRLVGYTNDKNAYWDLLGCDHPGGVQRPQDNRKKLFENTPRNWIGNREDFNERHSGWPYEVSPRYRDCSKINGYPRIPTTDTEQRLRYFTDDGFRKTLAYCPLCIESDIKNCGESYWHCIHQLAGVFVCPTHRVFLERINAKTFLREWMLICPPELGSSGIPNPEHTNPKDPEHQLLVQIATDTQKIFEKGLKHVHFERVSNLFDEAVHRDDLLLKARKDRFNFEACNYLYAVSHMTLR